MSKETVNEIEINQLKKELEEMLLDPNSNLSLFPEHKQLIKEHEDLVSRKKKTIDLKIIAEQLLPNIELAELDVNKAEKELTFENSKLASYAEELGRSVFAAYQAGDIPNQSILTQRINLESQIESLKNERQNLLLETANSFFEKTKQQMRQVTLAGKIKILEFQIGSANRALGQSLLDCSDHHNFTCPSTSNILHLVKTGKEKVSQAQELLLIKESTKKAELAFFENKFGRFLANSKEIQHELITSKIAINQINKNIVDLKYQVINYAKNSNKATNHPEIGPKLEKVIIAKNLDYSKFKDFINLLKNLHEKWFSLNLRSRLVTSCSIALMFYLTYLLECGLLRDKSTGSLTTKSDISLIKEKGIEPNLADLSKPIITNGPLDMKFSALKKGTTYLGWNGNQGSAKKIELKEDFEIAIHTVTQGQWLKVMGNNPSSFSRTGEYRSMLRNISDDDLALFPVETVSWNDCHEFINKLNEKEKSSGFIYRLPTTDEWEYACRGGSSSQQECSYHYYFQTPTNNISTSQVNFNPNNSFFDDASKPFLNRPTKVGSYPPNKIGIYDMHGNVSQWTDSVSDNDKSRIIIRGGSWLDSATSCQTVWPMSKSTSNKGNYVGFRLVRTQIKYAATEANINLPKNTSEISYYFGGEKYKAFLEKWEENKTDFVYLDLHTKNRAFTITNDNTIKMDLFFKFIDPKPDNVFDQIQLSRSSDSLEMGITSTIGNPLATFDPPDLTFSPKISITIKYNVGDTSNLSKNGTRFFGKQVNLVPIDKQNMSLLTSKTQILFVPTKTFSSGYTYYGDIQSNLILNVIKKDIERDFFAIEIGLGRIFQLNNEAKRSLYLLERAISMLRHRKGIRDGTTHSTLGD